MIRPILDPTLLLVTTLMALRDRGRNGGSYHGTAALTAYNMATLLPEVGLCPPEIVKKIQDKFSFAPMMPDLHVEDLFFLIVEAWHKKPNLTSDKKFWTVFNSVSKSITSVITAVF